MPYELLDDELVFLAVLVVHQRKSNRNRQNTVEINDEITILGQEPCHAWSCQDGGWGSTDLTV